MMRKDHTEMLQSVGLKATPARLSVLALFEEKKGPMDAEYISTKLKAVDPVTVYRTLQSLEKAKVIRKVDLRKDSVQYELSLDHHHHIVCNECGDIEEFEACGAEALSKKILADSSKFKSLTDHSFELFGICESCTSRRV